MLACMTFLLATEVGQTTHLDRMEENRPFWHSLFCTRYTFCVLAPNMTQFTYPVFSVQSHACSRPASTGTRHLHVDKLSIHRLEIIVMRGTRAHGVGRWVAQPKERQSGRNAKNIRPRSKHTGKRQCTARHRHVQALSGVEVLSGNPVDSEKSGKVRCTALPAQTIGVAWCPRGTKLEAKGGGES